MTGVTYFPRSTLPYQRRASEREWEDRGPPAFRKLTFSLVDMAVVTGVLLRLGRAVVLTHAPRSTGIFFAGAFALGALFLFAMLTLHLGNFLLRHWTWRAPTFAALEAAVETVMSAALIAIDREPYGAGHATYGDWLPMTVGVFSWRMVAVAAFVIALAVVVHWARVTTLRREHRL